MALQTLSGSLVLVNVNQPEPVVSWNGQQLANVQSIAVAARRNGFRRTAIRVTDPADVVPALTPDEVAARNTLYAEMTAAGIDILKR